MTVKTYFADKPVLAATVVYRMISATGWTQTVDRRTAARLASAPDFPADWRIERVITQSYVQGCPWCGARPVLWEQDCDGWYATATCGSDQCDKLQRCNGCGKDDSAAVLSWRGTLCRECDDIAYKAGLQAAGDRYALIPMTD